MGGFRDVVGWNGGLFLQSGLKMIVRKPSCFIALLLYFSVTLCEIKKNHTEFFLFSVVVLC